MLRGLCQSRELAGGNTRVVSLDATTSSSPGVLMQNRMSVINISTTIGISALGKM
jgi:hypothetical protein